MARQILDPYSWLDEEILIVVGGRADVGGSVGGDIPGERRERVM